MCESRVHAGTRIAVQRILVTLGVASYSAAFLCSSIEHLGYRVMLIVGQRVREF